MCKTTSFYYFDNAGRFFLNICDYDSKNKVKR